jgi:multidrug resistance efflux pump
VKLDIRAPFTGKAMNVAGIPGQQMGAGSELCVLVDDTRMRLSQFFSYAYEHDITVGMHAEISIPSLMAVIPGRVSSIERVRRVMPDGTISFEVEFILNNPGALSKDMTATATMFTASGEEILPTGPGTLAFYREEIIAAGVDGTIVETRLRNYHSYTVGSIVCRLENPVFSQNISRNEQAITAIQLDIEENLYPAVEESRRKIEEYQSQLEDLTVYAPISGLLLSVVARPGIGYPAGQSLVEIAVVDPMIIQLQMSESEVIKVRAGMEAEVHDINGGIHRGVITFVSMQSASDGWMPFYPVDVEVYSFGSIMIGSWTRVTIFIDKRDDVITLPPDAVKNTRFGPVVFVRRDVRPEYALDLPEATDVPAGFYPVPVAIGLGTIEKIEIISGVNEGDEVFVANVDFDPNEGMEFGDDGSFSRPVTRSVVVRGG